MSRALSTSIAVVALLFGCEPEPELAVAEASLVDSAPVFVPVPDGGRDGRPLTEAELRAERLKRDITADNAIDRARELEAQLDAELVALQNRLQPVDVDMDGP